MDPRQRFSDRAKEYAAHRPGYSVEIVETLRRECGLTPDSAVADVGCGTGMLAKLFCEFGCRVYGVEPNPAMLESARRQLGGFPNFIPVVGEAEATTLAAGSVDFVTAGQAFHWFEPQAARREFVRILRPGGWVVLIWNERLIEATPFTRAYEDLLVKFGLDYGEVKARWAATSSPKLLERFFAPARTMRTAIDNPQTLDQAGLVGRILSASYMPRPEHARFPAMLAAINALFRQHEVKGMVTMAQEVRMYFGRIGF